MDARRTKTCVTPTCVAPRHVDASRDYFFFFSERVAWEEAGGGGCAATFYFLFFSLFSRPRAGLATV